MTGYELGEWEAFERLHGPILIHERIDAAIAMISTAVYRAGGAKVEDTDPSRFLPAWDGEDRSPSEERLIANIRSMMKPKEEPSP